MPDLIGCQVADEEKGPPSLRFFRYLVYRVSLVSVFCLRFTGSEDMHPEVDDKRTTHAGLGQGYG